MKSNAHQGASSVSRSVLMTRAREKCLGYYCFELDPVLDLTRRPTRDPGFQQTDPLNLAAHLPIIGHARYYATSRGDIAVLLQHPGLRSRHRRIDTAQLLTHGLSHGRGWITCIFTMAPFRTQSHVLDTFLQLCSPMTCFSCVSRDCQDDLGVFTRPGQSLLRMHWRS